MAMCKLALGPVAAHSELDPVLAELGFELGPVQFLCCFAHVLEFLLLYLLFADLMLASLILDRVLTHQVQLLEVTLDWHRLVLGLVVAEGSLGHLRSIRLGVVGVELALLGDVIRVGRIECCHDVLPITILDLKF